MKKLISLLLALVMALSLVACGSKGGKKNDESVELTVFAAASLTESLTAIGDKYMAEKNVKISFTFDSSGKLLTQIEEGAVCDLFISAAPKQMNALDGSLRIIPRRTPRARICWWPAAALTCWRTRWPWPWQRVIPRASTALTSWPIC